MKQIICGYEIEFSYDHSCKKHIATNESIGLSVKADALCEVVSICEHEILLNLALQSISVEDFNRRIGRGKTYGKHTKQAIEKINNG